MIMNRRRFLQAAGAGAVLGMTRASWGFHDDGLPLVQPSYGDIGGLEILGYTDLRLPGSPTRDLNWDRVFEFRVVGDFAYCGNGGRGWSIVDVSNPRSMRLVHRQPHADPSTDNTQYIDIKGDNILVVKRNRALEMWDVRNPSAPVRLSSFTPDLYPVEDPRAIGAPFHGLWIHEDDHGRRYAFAACQIAGFTLEILICVDITDPANPFERARWWYPGMGPGETPTWSEDITVRCHDMTTFGDRCYAAWRDKGLIILDISDIRNTTKDDRLPLVGEINWADGLPRRRLDGVDVDFPSLPGQTHSFGIVVPKRGGRVETVVGTDELGQCPFGFLHFIDVRNESRPTEISQFRVPLNFHGNCPADRLGNRMGIHDVERMIRGNIVWGAWEEGGFWGVDFSDIHYPRHVAYYEPPVRSDSTRRSGHADDVFVMDDGIIFGSSSDAGAGGLWAMRHTPGSRGKVAWNVDESNVIVTTNRQGDGR